MTYQPGWYPDPVGRFEFRFHNGNAWTGDVATAGNRFVDPLGPEPPAGGRSKGMAIAAMVLGIVAVSVAWVPFIFVIGTLCGLVAIVLGIVALRRSGREARGFAVAGIATGVAGLFLTTVGVALSIAVVDVVDSFNNPEPHRTRITGCSMEGSRALAVGEIENLGDEAADFVVTVAFVRPGTDNATRQVFTSIDDVPPGDTAPFDVGAQVELDRVECQVVEVTGPLPFGIDLTP